jgi:hypothetical protein
MAQIQLKKVVMERFMTGYKLVSSNLNSRKNEHILKNTQNDLG